LGDSFSTKQIEKAVAIARDLFHIVAEKAVFVAPFIGIYAQLITVIAVQSHASCNPNVSISVGI
jgi:hypothetical protein